MTKWALIIGASGGIGQQIATTLAADGWSLYLHYHQHGETIQQMVDQFNHQYAGQEFVPVQYDLTDEENLSALTSNIFALDALVFAQGTTHYSLFKDLPLVKLQTMLQMQVVTPLRLVQEFEDKLARSSHGRIVFLGSVYGGAGSPMEVGYSTVKGALSAFARAYAQEIASTGITVNVVAPGAVATPMNDIFTGAEKAAVTEEIPAGRFADPNEISYWVKVLLDPAAQYLTGETIYVTGGWLR